MTKNNKYVYNLQLFVSLLYLVVREGVDGGLNSVFGHICTKNYIKIKTDFYFALSSLTLQTLTILYFSYI